MSTVGPNTVLTVRVVLTTSCRFLLTTVRRTKLSRRSTET
jgi:hypothetical protein